MYSAATPTWSRLALAWKRAATRRSIPQGEFTGKNLLYTAASVDNIVATTGRTAEDVIDALGRARLTLFGARLHRPRPHLDDKVLAAWNGLMIAAFARAARLLRARRFGLHDTASAHLATAQRAARFLRRRMWDDQRLVLLRRFRDGDAAVDGYAEDYAALAFGLLELFQADGDPAWLQWADQLQTILDQRFYDPIDGGWFSTTGEDPTVLVRSKEDYDGAEPSPTALALLNLQMLTHLRPDADRTARISQSIARFGTRLGEYSRAVPLVLAALVGEEAGISQLVIVEADGGAEGAAALRDVAAEYYRPFQVEVPVTPAHARTLAAALPLIEAMGPVEGQSAAYLCANFTCQAPVTSPEALRAEFARAPRSSGYSIVVQAFRPADGLNS